MVNGLDFSLERRGMKMSKDFIQKITAPNGSMFTGSGTNSYLIGKNDLTLVDPGPKIDAHIEKLINLGEGKINRILVTHTHRDHSPAAKVLGEMLDVPLMGRLLEKDDSLQDKTFKPDRVLNHGDLIETDEYTIETIYTPGHASNHLCYLLEEEKMIFTGDHIMEGSTVVIGPPDGNMKQYIESLEKLKQFDMSLIAPGHGNLMKDPKSVVDWIVSHRMFREKKVVDALTEFSKANLDQLVEKVYDDVDERLHGIARASLLAHLNKLIEEDKAVSKGDEFHWKG